MNAYGLIYKNTFNPVNPSEILLHTDDDSGSDLQFRLNTHLIGGVTYVLVITTSLFKETSRFSVVVLGVDTVILKRLSKSICICIVFLKECTQVRAFDIKCSRKCFEY